MLKITPPKPVLTFLKNKKTCGLFVGCTYLMTGGSGNPRQFCWHMSVVTIFDICLYFVVDDAREVC